MNVRVLKHTHLLAAVMFVAAILVLAVQLITPSPVVVSMGENGADATNIGQYFTYSEVAIVLIASAVAGASGTYLVLHNQAHLLANHSQATTRTNPRPQREANGGVDAKTSQAGMNAGRSNLQDENWEETLNRLRNNEEIVYSKLLDANGELAQRKLVGSTDLSKATVSRTLDKLENRGLVVRERSGMGNTIRLSRRMKRR